MEITVLKQNSKSYPERLNKLHKSPKVLRTRGAELNQLLQTPVLGVVGSRKVSTYGRGITEKLTEDVARKGVCIVSGLALGVDSIAHESSLRASGKTIAVLPSGIKNIYPASHFRLAQNILRGGGTLVSEYADDFIPRRESFIERNRIIAALSDALLVTEAAERSGSLYTAEFALELGIPVLAVPGNINSATSVGTNNLLKMGATFVTTEQDIFDAMKITDKVAAENMELFGDNEQESLIIQLLKAGTVSGNELLDQSEFEIQLFQQTLTMLEIKGIIQPLGNNNWRLK